MAKAKKKEKQRTQIPANELDAFLKDSSTVFRLCEYPIARVINNDFELRKFIVRFVSYVDEHEVNNLDIINFDFVNEVEGFDSDAEVDAVSVNVLSDDPRWSYDEASMVGYKAADIKIVDASIKYPCVVRIEEYVMIHISLLSLLDGSIITGYPVDPGDGE